MVFQILLWSRIQSCGKNPNVWKSSESRILVDHPPLLIPHRHTTLMIKGSEMHNGEQVEDNGIMKRNQNLFQIHGMILLKDSSKIWVSVVDEAIVRKALKVDL